MSYSVGPVLSMSKKAMVVGFVDNLALVVVDAKMDLNEPISAIIAVAADSRV